VGSISDRKRTAADNRENRGSRRCHWRRIPDRQQRWHQVIAAFNLVRNHASSAEVDNALRGLDMEYRASLRGGP
jgi:hypothetical protein